MRRGDTFPTINVARIDRKLFVVDGFHRLAAAKQLKLPGILTDIAKLSHEEAVTFAIDANTSHGLSLSREDKKRSFNLYRTAGLHLKPNGDVKPLRNMQKDLHKIAWPNTLRAWLKEAAIEPGDPESDETPFTPREPEIESEGDTEMLLSMTMRIDCLTADFFSIKNQESRSTIHGKPRIADNEWIKAHTHDWLDI